MGAEKAVIVKGGDNAIREEFAAGGVITPGQLLEINSSDAVIRHNSAGANQYALIALQDFPQGKDIDDNYASGEQVQAIWARSGMIVNMLLKEGETVVKGGFVESDGAGDVQAHTADTADSDDAITVFSNQIVGVAREAVDLSDSSVADPATRRILIQII